MFCASVSVSPAPEHGLSFYVQLNLEPIWLGLKIPCPCMVGDWVAPASWISVPALQSQHKGEQHCWRDTLSVKNYPMHEGTHFSDA